MTAEMPPKVKKFCWIYFLKYISKNALTIDTTGAIIIIVAFCPLWAIVPFAVGKCKGL